MRTHKFTALKLRWDVNLGAYVSGRSGWPVGNIGGTAGVYHIPAIYAEVCGIMTHTVPTAAYRGAGRPEATYTIERLIDVAARELGISPYELRRRNLIPPEAMPYKTALTFTYDCGEFEGNMQTAADAVGARQSSRRDVRKREARGKLRGIGLCNCIEVAGGPFLRPAKDLSTLRLAEDGTLILRSGSMSVGQGLETAFSPDRRRAFRRAAGAGALRAGRHRPACRRQGQWRIGRAVHRRIGGVARGGQGDREGQAHRRGTAGSGGGRRDVRRRPLHHRRHGSLDRSRRGRARRARSRAYSARRGRRPGRERRIHRRPP